MRKIRYGVAMSLDGYIAGPNGEADWIEIEPEFDFGKLWAQFDTGLMGRRTYEVAMARLGEAAFQGMKTFVFSRTLRPADHPGVTILSELDRDWLQALRAESGKDIWLFGGGELFRQLLAIGMVDTVEVAVKPVLLGEGLALLPPPARGAKLKLVSHEVYRLGTLSLVYDVEK
jgi:dihydrofolate reductase